LSFSFQGKGAYLTFSVGWLSQAGETFEMNLVKKKKTLSLVKPGFQIILTTFSQFAGCSVINETLKEPSKACN